MSSLSDTHNFNNPARVIEGWYWALRSAELKRGRAQPLTFLGRELVVYRGAGGRVYALDAYCPHMGAHLAEGKVEGEEIRCLFHHWKYDAAGRCVEIPCQAACDFVPRVRAWPVEERYGLVWIWSGRHRPHEPLPCVPELAGQECESKLGRRFVKECHPNVMMINAIDAQHFNSVHRLPVDLNLEPTEISESCILFRNTTRLPRTSAFTRFLGRFYRDALTYVLCYWFASTGSVTIGPDRLHFHIMFTLRPTAGGRAEGQTILVTRRRRGLFGKVWARALLLLTRAVGDYFAKGDTLIFKSIRFNLRTPIKADLPIIRFIQHAERQRATAWGLPLAGEEAADESSRDAAVAVSTR
jgi:phenylpropionate dioxygenase-like ring-hydroxylating dioxygenase large terminal subunit